MKYLKLFLDQSEIFKSLPDQEAGQLIKAVFAYMNGEKIELTGMLNVVFVSIRQGLDRSIEEYENTVLRNRENGKKGGRPQKPTGLSEKPKKPTGLSGLAKKPTKTQDEEEDEEEEIKELPSKLNGHSFRDSEVGAAPQINVFKLTDKMWEQHQINERAKK